MGRPKHSSPNIDRILGALLDERDDWHYGYELSRRLDIAPGSLYPALIRLSDDGLLEAQWEIPGDGGRPRHLYRITAAGAAFVAGRTVTRHGRRDAAMLPPRWSGGLA